MISKDTLLSHYNIGISQTLLAKLSSPDSHTDPLASAIQPFLIGVDTTGENVFVPSWYINEPTLAHRLSIEELTELDLIYSILEGNLKKRGNQALQITFSPIPVVHEPPGSVTITGIGVIPTLSI